MDPIKPALTSRNSHLTPTNIKNNIKKLVCIHLYINRRVDFPRFSLYIIHIENQMFNTNVFFYQKPELSDDDDVMVYKKNFMENNWVCKKSDVVLLTGVLVL